MVILLTNPNFCLFVEIQMGLSSIDKLNMKFPQYFTNAWIIQAEFKGKLRIRAAYLDWRPHFHLINVKSTVTVKTNKNAASQGRNWQRDRKSTQDPSFVYLFIILFFQQKFIEYLPMAKNCAREKDK